MSLVVSVSNSEKEKIQMTVGSMHIVLFAVVVMVSVVIGIYIGEKLQVIN